MYCGNCGSKLPDEAAFCPFCGNKVRRAPLDAAAAEDAADKTIMTSVSAEAADTVETAAAEPEIETPDIPEAPVADVTAETPVEELPASEPPAEDMFAAEMPAEDTSIPEPPAEDLAAAEMPAEDISIPESPAEDFAAADTFADETPASEFPAEELPAQGYVPQTEQTERFYMDGGTSEETEQIFETTADGAGQEEAGSVTGAGPEKKRGGKKKLFLILGISLAAVITIAAAVLIPVLMHNTKQTKYNQGVAMLENGDYEGAQEIFASLGSFEDSQELLEKSADSIRYQEALSLMNSGKFADAQKAFGALSGFYDADRLADECGKALRYEEGVKLFSSGDYASAADAFKAAGNYSDAESRATESLKAVSYEEGEKLFAEGDYSGAAAAFGAAGDYLDAAELARISEDNGNYESALKLMDEGSYAEAAELLLSLDPDEFPDRDDLLYESENMPKYLEAVDALSAGQRYAAYKAFNELGNFKDSSKLKNECIVSMPSTGELYHNDDYKGSACSLTVKPPSDGSATYFKIYNADESALVSAAFINSGDKVKIKLPAGDYIFKASYSYGAWFGEDEMFGDDGVYQRLRSSGSSDVFTLKKNYVYTLTLRTADTSGDSVATDNESRAKF